MKVHCKWISTTHFQLCRWERERERRVCVCVCVCVCVILFHFVSLAYQSINHISLTVTHCNTRPHQLWPCSQSSTTAIVALFVLQAVVEDWEWGHMRCAGVTVCVYEYMSMSVVIYPGMTVRFSNSSSAIWPAERPLWVSDCVFTLVPRLSPFFCAHKRMSVSNKLNLGWLLQHFVTSDKIWGWKSGSKGGMTWRHVVPTISQSLFSCAWEWTYTQPSWIFDDYNSMPIKLNLITANFCTWQNLG